MTEASDKEALIHAALERALAAARAELLECKEALADVPLGLVEELLEALTGSAVAAVLAARFDQIAVRGHTREDDDMLPLGQLPRQAIGMTHQAIERIDATQELRNLPLARKRLARSGALGLAAIDRLLAAEAGAQSAPWRQA